MFRVRVKTSFYSDPKLPRTCRSLASFSLLLDLHGTDKKNLRKRPGKGLAGKSAH